MDKQRLNLLINNPELLSREDQEGLSFILNEYPYMQSLYPLMVLYNKKYNTKEYKSSLQTAAIFSLDRIQLKEVLASFDFSEEKTIERSLTSEVKIISDGDSSNRSVESNHLPNSFFTELYQEMDKLKKSKDAYNSILKKLETDSKERAKLKKSESAKKLVPAKEGSKSNKTASKASKSNLKKKNTTSVKNKATKEKVVKKKMKPDAEHQTIIEEIKLKEIKAINNEHLMEQINLITSFIEKEPSINKKMMNNNVDAKRVIEDLSESSTHLSDDVISETLAKLMVKQGRKEKAIDIYKKLIWKFPQKKTYFADQIKNLKKEE